MPLLNTSFTTTPTPMTRLIICRHATTKHIENQLIQTPETPLSKEGIRQAHKLSARLIHEQIELFVHSPYTRAQQTCKILSTHHPNTPIKCLDDLKERDYGIFKGQPRHEYDTALEKSGLPREEYKPPKGENYNDVYERATSVWNYLLEISTDYSTIAIISHSVLISNLIATALKQPKETAPAYRELHGTPTALSIIKIHKNHAIPHLIGDTRHLDE